jgi:hypothetical protein
MVPWDPQGVPHTFFGNTRYTDLNAEQRSLFVEVTGPPGTCIIFTHDIIHQSWHENDSYRRVVHLVYSHGDGETATAAAPRWAAAHAAAEEGSWLQYLVRDTSEAAAVDEEVPPAKL